MTGASIAYHAATNRVILFGGWDLYHYYPETWSYDETTSSWTNLNLNPCPAAQIYSTMAYDPDTQTIIFFGISSNNSAATWSFDGSKWTQLYPISSPPAKSNASMAYDENLGKFILYGGWRYDNGEYCTDTWSFDVKSTTWEQLSSSAPISATCNTSMVYDGNLKKIILFGGRDSSAYNLSSDTWAFDASTTPPTWKKLNIINPPTARAFASMIYDSAFKQVVLFGGYVSTPPYRVNDTWILSNGSNWIQTSQGGLTTPSIRSDAAMAYITAQDRIILFGGDFVDSSNFETCFGDTWLGKAPYSYEMSQLSTSPSPSNRADASMVYDETMKQCILFGGLSNSSVLNDTWSFNGSNWNLLSPSISPSGRCFASMAYNKSNSQILLFGGQNSSYTNLEDTWYFDGNNWNNLTPSPIPSNYISARSSASMVYDEIYDVYILFGGQDDSNNPLGDTWKFDASNWTQVSSDPSPAARYGASMVYDPITQKIFLFGGVGQTIFNDTWSFDTTSLTWKQLSPSVSPPPRCYASMIYDHASGRIVMFGGNAGQDVGLQDAWSFDGNNWIPISLSSSPSARTNASMAYDMDSDVIVLFGGYDELITGGFLGDTWIAKLQPMITKLSSQNGPMVGGAAVITKQSLQNGPVMMGATITLSGTKFTNAQEVLFGSTPSPSFSVLADDTLEATIPPGSGTVNVSVRTPGGVSPIKPYTTYTYLPPKIHYLSTRRGPATGGTAVQITGANLQGTETVWFGHHKASSVSVSPDGSSVTAIAPRGKGTVALTLVGINKIFSVTSSDQFSYIPLPPINGKGIQNLEEGWVKLSWLAPKETHVKKYIVYSDFLLMHPVAYVKAHSKHKAHCKFRSVPGIFTYYVVCVDTYGNRSDPLSISVDSSQHSFCFEK